MQKHIKCSAIGKQNKLLTVFTFYQQLMDAGMPLRIPLPGQNPVFNQVSEIIGLQ